MAFQTSNPALARALAERDYNDPTPVQTAVLAPETAGRDLLVSAQTGSGKTVAYGLAIAATLLGSEERFGNAAEPLALIVAPTRELALQVQRELTWLYAGAGARIISCVGGMDARAEQRQLNMGCHIVVGTPGRLRDHLERGRHDVSGLKAVVLDEADEMLDLGFREDLEFILQTTPEDRQTLLFSATLPRTIFALAKRYQNDAMRIEVKTAEGGHADIEYRAIRITPKEMEHAVVNVLRFFDSPTAMVFCNTRNTVRHLHAILQERGFSAVALSGELSQNDRNQALQALRDGRARVCVATDVAARGIDLPNLGLVIHADLPNDEESLQHRSGRTGRAGRKGVSVLMVPASRRRRAEDFLRAIGVTAEWGSAPTPEEIGKLDHERMLRDPMLTDEPGEDDLELGRSLLEAYSPEHVAAALARIYRARLPAPEEVSDPGEGRPIRDRAASRREFESAGSSSGGGGGGGSVWFKLNIGRRKNADPRWLLPLICRRGGVTKKDIGAIRIFEEESAFEVSAAAAENFTKAARVSVGNDVAIDPLPGGLSSMSDGGARSAPAKREYGDKPAYAKRSYAKPGEDRPAYGNRDESSKPAYEKPAYEKPAEPPKVYGKFGDDKPGYAKKAYAKPGAEKPGAEKVPYAKRVYDGKPGDAGRDERPAGAKPAYAKRVYDKPGDERPAGAKPAFAKKPYESRGDKPAFAKPAYKAKSDRAGPGPAVRSDKPKGKPKPRG